MRTEHTMFVTTDETGKLTYAEIHPFLDNYHRKPIGQFHLFVGNHVTILVVNVSRQMTREAALRLAADYAASRLPTRTIEYCSLPYRIRNSHEKVTRKQFVELPAYPLLDTEW